MNHLKHFLFNFYNYLLNIMRFLYITILITAVFILLSGLIAKVKADTEKQKYETIYSDGNFEIRYYPQAIMATVNMNGTYDDSRNSGFRVLAGYIFGGNAENQKIAMTAPVRMSTGDKKSSMSFVLPSAMEFDNLPTPNSKRILLHKSKPVYAAVVRYGGYTNLEEIEKKKTELIKELKALNLEHNDNFEFLGYNAPYDMFNRRNEVLVELPGFNPDTFGQSTAARD